MQARPPRPFSTAQRTSNLYATERWRKESKTFLFGKRCVEPSCTNLATITDHEPPHRGNHEAFWDSSTWQPLCRQHHNAKTGHETRERLSSHRQAERHPGLIG